MSVPYGDLASHYAERATALTAGYERTPIGSMAVQIRAELPGLRTMLRKGVPTTIAADLYRSAGRLTALWATARHDLDDKAGATAAFAEAFGHSELANDRVLMCWIRLWQSSLARKAGNLNFALALARDGAAYVPPNSPSAARAAAIEARSLAALGHRWEVHEAIGRAWRITGDLTEDQGEPGFSIDTLATPTLAELSAAAYIELGNPNMAGVYVDVSLLELDYVGATGLQSMARFSGAAAAVQRGELEQALATAYQALDISAHRPTSVLSGRAERFVKDAVREIGPHPDLAELDERIRVWGLPPVV